MFRAIINWHDAGSGRPLRSYPAITSCGQTTGSVGGRCRPLRPQHRRLLQDTGGSLVLTYWPSEFSQIRGQFRRTRYGESLTANEFLFQFHVLHRRAWSASVLKELI